MPVWSSFFNLKNIFYKIKLRRVKCEGVSRKWILPKTPLLRDVKDHSRTLRVHKCVKYRSLIAPLTFCISIFSMVEKGVKNNDNYTSNNKLFTARPRSLIFCGPMWWLTSTRSWRGSSVFLYFYSRSSVEYGWCCFKEIGFLWITPIDTLENTVTTN